MQAGDRRSPGQHRPSSAAMPRGGEAASRVPAARLVGDAPALHLLQGGWLLVAWGGGGEGQVGQIQGGCPTEAALPDRGPCRGSCDARGDLRPVPAEDTAGFLLRGFFHSGKKLRDRGERPIAFGVPP